MRGAEMFDDPHGAVAGGYGGAGAARRLGRAAVRRIVVAIGFGMTISLFIRREPLLWGSSGVGSQGSSGLRRGDTRVEDDYAWVRHPVLGYQR